MSVYRVNDRIYGQLPYIRVSSNFKTKRPWQRVPRTKIRIKLLWKTSNLEQKTRFFRIFGTRFSMLTKTYLLDPFCHKMYSKMRSQKVFFVEVFWDLSPMVPQGASKDPSRALKVSPKVPKWSPTAIPNRYKSIKMGPRISFLKTVWLDTSQMLCFSPDGGRKPKVDIPKISLRYPKDILQVSLIYH